MKLAMGNRRRLLPQMAPSQGSPCDICEALSLKRGGSPLSSWTSPVPAAFAELATSAKPLAASERQRPRRPTTGSRAAARLRSRHSRGSCRHPKTSIRSSRDPDARDANWPASSFGAGQGALAIKRGVQLNFSPGASDPAWDRSTNMQQTVCRIFPILHFRQPCRGETRRSRPARNRRVIEA
jgi:hypothetical protein